MATPLLLRAGTVRGLLVAFALVALVALAVVVRSRVAGEAQASVGDWQLRLANVPAWLPAGYTGQLAGLSGLPRAIPLVSSSWHDQLLAALEDNPWVSRVQRLERSGELIEFSAELVRPVVGILALDGFLLCDGHGRVVDWQPGRQLDPAWRMPSYRPETGPLPRLASGVQLTGPEFDQLFALLAVLWDQGIYARHADLLPDLYSRPTSGGDRFWFLTLVDGPDLDWGRAPPPPVGSPGLDPSRPDGIGSARKLTHLQRTLKHRAALRDVPLVRLWDASGPLVGVSR